MIGYFDLPSGLSGDMFLSCLVDAGWPIEQLRASIKQLHLPEGSWSVDGGQVSKGVLRATQVAVQCNDEKRHRHLPQIRKIIEASNLSVLVRQRALSVFARLAEAEAKVHGIAPEKVHFHEVGALDAIIDIVGAAAGLEALDLDELYASAVPLSDGWADTEHGRLPLPAPATLELLLAVQAPTRPGPGPGEWITPTAAALLAELATFRQPNMKLDRIGIGAGQRDAVWPNIARLWVGRPVEQGPMIQMETNIDDMNPQFYTSVSEHLMAAGARDVWLTPVQMKKGRPGVVLSVLAASELETVLTDLILRETTTLGLRVFPVHRHEAVREVRKLETPYGTVDIKLKRVDRDLIGATPEYETCASLAKSASVSVRQVYEAALSAAQQKYGYFGKRAMDGTKSTTEPDIRPV